VGREGAKIIPLMLALAAYLTWLSTAEAQAVRPAQTNMGRAAEVFPTSCETIRMHEPVKQALEFACSRTKGTGENASVSNVLIIGLVGGFVKHDDLNHPEVDFGAPARNQPLRSCDGVCKP